MLIAVVALTIIAGIIIVLFFQNQKIIPVTKNIPRGRSEESAEKFNAPRPPLVNPLIAEDKKSIVSDGQVLVTIDNDVIFDLFKTGRTIFDNIIRGDIVDKMSDENKTSFKNKVRFVSIVVSSDKMKIGFIIENDFVPQFKVAGIFSLFTNRIYLFPNNYPGNESINFSPNGENFLYQSDCFSLTGGCIVVSNLDTYTEKIDFNNPDYVYFKIENAEFIRWISNNEIEYKLGTELKRKSLISSKNREIYLNIYSVKDLTFSPDSKIVFDLWGLDANIQDQAASLLKKYTFSINKIPVKFKLIYDDFWLNKIEPNNGKRSNFRFYITLKGYIDGKDNKPDFGIDYDQLNDGHGPSSKTEIEDLTQSIPIKYINK